MQQNHGEANQRRKLKLAISEHAEVQQFCQVLIDEGFNVYAVGGFVRDVLAGVNPSDIDLTTDAPPDRVHELAKKNQIKCNLHGLRFGAIRLGTKPFSFVVTTFRRETVFQQRATVEFTTSLLEDVVRRDFTINAIYADSQGRIQDPLNGCADLERQIVRFIGNPGMRISEDPFRMLRFFRLRAQFANLDRPIEPELLLAIRQYAARIISVSQERISSEILKLLNARVASPVLADMQSCEVLKHCLPAANLNPLRSLEYLEQHFNAIPDPIRRIAVLVGGTERCTLRLGRLALKRLDHICQWIWSSKSDSELVRQLDYNDALGVLLARTALSSSVADIQAMTNIRQQVSLAV